MVLRRRRNKDHLETVDEGTQAEEEEADDDDEMKRVNIHRTISLLDFPLFTRKARAREERMAVALQNSEDAPRENEKW